MKNEWPVTNAFLSWPLNPVAQGFTVTTLLLLKQIKTVNDTKTNKEKPPTVDHTITECCFWFFEVFELSWFEDVAGEGAEIQLDCCGVDTSVGGSDMSVKCWIGATTGEGETSGELNGDGIKNDGDGEFEGLIDGETCLENGDEDGGVDERLFFSSPFLVLCELAEFTDCRSFLMYCIWSPCWPMCLSQEVNLRHNLIRCIKQLMSWIWL